MDITILNICRLPENSNLLQQLYISQFQLALSGGGGGGGGEWAQLKLTDALFLTDDEALTIVGNAHCVIPENLVFKKTTEKSRREIIQDVLSNDPRNKHEQVWT